MYFNGFNMLFKNRVTRNGKAILERRADLAVLRTYVENQAMLEPILL